MGKLGLGSENDLSWTQTWFAIVHVHSPLYLFIYLFLSKDSRLLKLPNILVTGITHLLEVLCLNSGKSRCNTQASSSQLKRAMQSHDSLAIPSNSLLKRPLMAVLVLSLCVVWHSCHPSFVYNTIYESFHVFIHAHRDNYRTTEPKTFNYSWWTLYLSYVVPKPVLDVGTSTGFTMTWTVFNDLWYFAVKSCIVLFSWLILELLVQFIDKSLLQHFIKNKNGQFQFHGHYIDILVVWVLCVLLMGTVVRYSC